MAFVEIMMKLLLAESVFTIGPISKVRHKTPGEDYIGASHIMLVS